MLSWEGRKSLYVRFYDKENRRYVVRSLGTGDQGEATDKAIALWRDIQPKIESGHPTQTQTIASLVALYIDEELKRVEAGLIKRGAVRDKQAQLKPMLIYCGLNSLTTITQVKEHSFNDFVAWRRDESLRITTGRQGKLEHTSLNKAIREVRAWWKWVRKKRLSIVALEVMEVSSRHERPRKKNIAFTDDHWELIENELLRRTKDLEGERREYLPTQILARFHLKCLIQTLVESGMRPQEATNIIRWKNIEFKDDENERLNINFKGTLVNLSTTCVINIINPTGKGSRPVVCDAGMILKTWFVESVKFRKSVGLHPLQKDTLVFGNPITGLPFAYGGLATQFRKILKDLELNGMGYTIRSCRGYYITKMLALGHSPYLLARNAGHSVDVMRKNYEQLTADDLLEEFG